MRLQTESVQPTFEQQCRQLTLLGHQEMHQGKQLWYPSISTQWKITGDLLTLDVILQRSTRDQQLRSSRERPQRLVQLTFRVLQSVGLNITSQ